MTVGGSHTSMKAGGKQGSYYISHLCPDSTLILEFSVVFNQNSCIIIILSSSSSCTSDVHFSVGILILTHSQVV
jgi:hypothetical protein